MAEPLSLVKSLSWPLVAGCWMIFIIVECWTPRPPVAPPSSDVVAHAAGFAVLGVLLVMAVGLRDARSSALFALVIGVLWGTVTELGQVCVPGRLVAFTDWVANAVGTGLGVLLLVLGMGLVAHIHNFRQEE